jgi:hypothetical protein
MSLKTSSESPNKKKRKTTKISAGEVDNSLTAPTLRSRSYQKDGALTTPTTPNLQKRQLDRNSGETTADGKSTLFVDAPRMREIREGVKQAKERQAESVNKQRAKKADKGGREKVLKVNDIYTLTLDSRIPSNICQ